MSLLNCERCNAPMMILDDSFWRKVSRKLKSSYRKDHGLFARMKGEFPTWPFPELDAPLTWLTSEWRRAKKLRGKQPYIEKRLFIASWIRKLSEPTFSIEFQDQQHGEPIVGDQILIDTKAYSGGAGTTIQKVRIIEHPPYMSVALARSVLFHEQPNFLRGLSGLKQKWRHFSEKQFIEIGKEFREAFKQCFGKVSIRRTVGK